MATPTVKMTGALGWHVQVTRGTDGVKLKNSHEQLEKGSEMKNIKLGVERWKGLVQKG